MRNHSYENDFDLHENETACRTHFHMKGFTVRHLLKQKHKNSEMAYYGRERLHASQVAHKAEAFLVLVT